jgi:hypothetical protein
VTACSSLAACGSTPAPRELPRSPDAQHAPPVVLWGEHFDHPSLDFIDPEDHGVAQLAKVYAVQRDGGLSFLHATHDGQAKGTPSPMHYGRAFRDDPVPLERVSALRFRWRARVHPNVGDDPLVDLAAGVYVVVHMPTVLGGGRGFKFGWLAKPGSKGTHQAGLLQVALRSDPAGPEWRSESVDLCRLYREEYGACEGQKLIYVGVTTDGDGTKSRAEGDYADFELVGARR